MLAGAVLLSAMTPFADPPEADLTGTLVVVSNGDQDPMIPAEMTRELVRQFRDRRAEVIELAHPGGHQIDSAVLAQIANGIARPEQPYVE